MPLPIRLVPLQEEKTWSYSSLQFPTHLFVNLLPKEADLSLGPSPPELGEAENVLGKRILTSWLTVA